MQHINVNLDKIVKNNLRKKRKDIMYESFVKVSKKQDEEEFLNEFFKTVDKLIKEGYTNKEIDKFLNEQPTGGLSGLVDQFGNAIRSQMGSDKGWGEIGKSTLWSVLKEKIIKAVARLFGVKDVWAERIAVVLADLSPLDLIRPFYDMQKCQTAMPKVVTSTVEAIVRELTGKATGTSGATSWSGLGTSIIGNAAAEVFRSSDMQKTISAELCKYIHKS